MAREFDGPWKEVLDVYFEPFVAFFYPDLHTLIDWTEPPVNLDTELQTILREGEVGAGRVDKLTRVKWLDGREQWLYIHVEVQSQPDTDLPRRIFSYHTRLFHLYDQHPVNLVILGDDSPNWRPAGYNVPHLDAEIRLPFWAVKLLDYAGRWDELETHPNPMGLVVSTHLRSLMTGNQPGERLASKIGLTRRLLTRGVDAKTIRQMYKVIDWFLELPPAETMTFRANYRALEQEFNMPYVTSTQRLATALALRKWVTMALVSKFGEPGQKFAEEHMTDRTWDLIEPIADNLERVATLDELRQAVGLPPADATP